MEKWKRKIAVITGAASRIVEAILKSFVEKGIPVIWLVIGVIKLKKFHDSLKEEFLLAKCDVSNFESIKHAFKWIEEKFGYIHNLINNSSILVSKNPIRRCRQQNYQHKFHRLGSLHSRIF